MIELSDGSTEMHVFDDPDQLFTLLTKPEMAYSVSVVAFNRAGSSDAEAAVTAIGMN